MNKFLVITLPFAVAVVVAATASANEWNLYGSARVATFYADTRNNDFNSSDSLGRDRVKNTIWNLQSNARVGAKFQGDKREWRFEYGTSTGSDLGDTYANVRLLYGVWKFAEDWGLKVGKDYTPVLFGLSRQVFDNDATLWRTGNAYGGRVGQIAIEGGGVKFAAIENPAPVLTVTDDAGNSYDAASEAYLPKVEASYQKNFTDKISVHAFGGWNNFKLYYSQVGSTVADSASINAYVFGMGGQFYFGPSYVKSQISYYNNGAVAGWLENAIQNATQFSTKPSVVNGQVNDIKSLMAMLALGYNPFEKLALEAGIGYLGTKADAGTYEKNTYLEYYLQAAIRLAPSFFIVPEVGYRDYGRIETQEAGAQDTDLGGTWYAGAKWQIDF